MFLHSFTMCVNFLLLAWITSSFSAASDFDPTNFKVFGPGLNADANVPARYFYVEVYNDKQDRVTKSIGERAIQASLLTRDGSRVQAWTQVLDRHDGSYIVRYRLSSSYPHGFVIHLTCGGKPVAASPYQLNGGVYDETCNCPPPNNEMWTSALGCARSYPQIDRDFSQYESINTRETVDALMKTFSNENAHSVCHYSIVNNEVYRRCNGKHTGFKQFMDQVLLSLVRKVRLPDVEFVSNLGDWPLVTRGRHKPLPLVSWCGSDDAHDLVLPTYDLMLSVLGTMERVTLDMLHIQANTGPVWPQKNNTAFWRGRDSRQERLELVKLSRRHPELLDAALTHMFFFPKDEQLYGPLQQRVAFYDFFKYKYQVTVDGTVAAYRFPYLLAGDSLVLKQDSPYYEHFYKELEPWTHYVPLKRDLSDLVQRLKWARNNDEQARAMAQRAQQFARSNLQAADVYCYHLRFFEKYSSLMSSEARVSKEQEKLEHPQQHCSCQRTSTPAHVILVFIGILFIQTFLPLPTARATATA